MRLPSLIALRAFEATGRLLSVTRAAHELHVTPGAVSQAVRTLERDLAVSLFTRGHRQVALTVAGRDYLPAISGAFRQIADATARLTARSAVGALRVSANASFAAAWLVPRLGRFQRAHPEIDVSLSTSDALVDFARDGVDLAIRHGLGVYPGLRSERLLAKTMLPVASTDRVARLSPSRAPRDVLRFGLLHDATRRDWPLWFEAHGVAFAEPLAGPSFDMDALLLTAALHGQGAALLPEPMARPEIAAGRLRVLLDLPWPARFAYYIVVPDTATEPPKVAAFRAWLRAEARSDAIGSSSGA